MAGDRRIDADRRKIVYIFILFLIQLQRSIISNKIFM